MGQGADVTLNVEPMAGRHVAAVRTVDELCYPRPWSAATWRSELASSDRTHLVGLIDDRLVGHAGSLLIDDELHITTVAVDPEYGGRGFATELCLRLLCSGIADGALAATLEVRAGDRRTQRIYGRLGFAPAGIRPGYYDKPTDDAVIMWLHDLSTPEQVARLDEIAQQLNAPALTEGRIQ